MALTQSCVLADSGEFFTDQPPGYRLGFVSHPPGMGGRLRLQMKSPDPVGGSEDVAGCTLWSQSLQADLWM